MNKIKFFRLERGLSQIELGEVSGLSRAVIQLVETGHRPVRTGERRVLSDALGVPESKLFSDPTIRRNKDK